MAVSLKLADAFVDISINRAQFNTGLAGVVADLGRLRGLGMITLGLDRGAATASLGLLRQQLDALRKDATVNVTVRQRVMGTGGREAGGIFGGGGGGGVGPAGSLGMGLLQGIGVAGFAMNPAMMAGAMIGGGLKESVSTAMDLEQTFVGLQRVSGESAANVEKFKRTIFDIGKTQAGVSIKDLTDISMAGAKAGITDKEGLGGLETFTRGMAKVRNSIQGMGTEQLANDMTRMLNLFGKGTSYVESFGSVLARMDNVSTSSASDILDMSKSLSGTFASLGMGIPQVMAFSSVLADVGLTNQQGASSFSQILRMLASQSEKMATLIGVPIDVFQQKVRTDAMGALGMLIARFKEINEVDPVKAQEFLVSLGFRGVKTAGALQQLSSMFDQVQERTKMAIEEETNLGSLQAANNLNSTTAIGNIQKLKNAFEELADAVGKVTLGPLTQLSKDALGIVKGLQGGGGKPGRPVVTESEMTELTALSALPEGAMFPKDVARRDELKRKVEERAAFDAGQKLSAGPATNAEAITAMEKALGTATAAQRPGMEAALARMRGEDTSAKEAAARAGRGAMLARPPGQGGMLELPVAGEAPLDLFRGIGEVGKTLESSMAGARRAAREAEERDVMARGGTSGAMLGRRTPAARTTEELADDKTLAEFARRREKLAEDQEAKRQNFQSQTFTDPADYAKSFLTSMLTDQSKDATPKLQLDEQKLANKLLQNLVDKILPPSMQKNNNGPMIFQGKA